VRFPWGRRGLASVFLSHSCVLPPQRSAEETPSCPQGFLRSFSVGRVKLSLKVQRTGTLGPVALPTSSLTTTAPRRLRVLLSAGGHLAKVANPVVDIPGDT
jgi:hypothetical protein